MPEETSLTPEQNLALLRARYELMHAFPNLKPTEIVEGPLAELIFGALPPYSGRTTHKMTDVTTATVGSFVLCHAYDSASHEDVVVVIKHGDEGMGENKFGVPGGYINLDTEEQPSQGAVRELREEVLDASGTAILDIDPARLSIIKTGVDYRFVEKGGYPVQYNAHHVTLTPEELKLVQDHNARLQTDPAYKTAVMIKSRGEVADVIVMPLSKAASLSPSQFSHPHELEAIRELRSILEKEPVKGCAPSSSGKKFTP
jgi:8-oxo-dGTP pyrophosphatase MutT (NUDIX family)